jgi:hypothetical protein
MKYMVIGHRRILLQADNLTYLFIIFSSQQWAVIFRYSRQPITVVHKGNSGKPCPPKKLPDFDKGANKAKKIVNLPLQC